MEGTLGELPRAGQGQTIAGRRQTEAGRTSREYLADFPEDEVGWTLETYIMAFCTVLERTGQPLDTKTLSYLIGSYSQAYDDLPTADWSSVYRQVTLGKRLPDVCNLPGGARAAVIVF